MEKNIYSNNYISTPTTLNLKWLKFTQEERNRDFKEYCDRAKKDNCCSRKCVESKPCCNDLSQTIQGITDPICFKGILGYKDTNLYGYFTSSTLYPKIIDRSKLIIFDYEYEFGSNSIFCEDSDIYITEEGNYKITYGVVSTTAINGRLNLLLNNREIHCESQMNKVSLTKFTTKLRLNNGDVLSLMVKGEFIRLYQGAINAFVIIEKYS